MSKQLPTYLKTYRKRLGMSQEVLAFLYGCEKGGKVSRIERGHRKPNLDDVFASEFIFGVAGHDVFPSRFESVAKTVKARAQRLLEKERIKDTPEARRNFRILERLLAHDVSERRNDVWKSNTEGVQLS